MRFLVAFCWLVVSVNISYAQTNNENDQYYLYLIGDAGEPWVASAPYSTTIQSQLTNNAHVPSAIVYLGDNVYPRGVEEEDHKNRKEGEQTLKDQVAITGERVMCILSPETMIGKREKEMAFSNWDINKNLLIHCAIQKFSSFPKMDARVLWKWRFRIRSPL